MIFVSKRSLYTILFSDISPLSYAYDTISESISSSLLSASSCVQSGRSAAFLNVSSSMSSTLKSSSNLFIVYTSSSLPTSPVVRPYFTNSKIFSCIILVLLLDFRYFVSPMLKCTSAYLTKNLYDFIIICLVHHLLIQHKIPVSYQLFPRRLL